jgi:hypothetical protein
VENIEDQCQNMVDVLIDSIDMECCGFGSDSTPNIANISSTLTNTLQWPLLAKQCDF